MFLHSWLVGSTEWFAKIMYRTSRVFLNGSSILERCGSRIESGRCCSFQHPPPAVRLMFSDRGLGIGPERADRITGRYEIEGKGNRGENTPQTNKKKRQYQQTTQTEGAQPARRFCKQAMDLPFLAFMRMYCTSKILVLSDVACSTCLGFHFFEVMSCSAS